MSICFQGKGGYVRGCIGWESSMVYGANIGDYKVQLSSGPGTRYLGIIMVVIFEKALSAMGRGLVELINQFQRTRSM